MGAEFTLSRFALWNSPASKGDTAQISSFTIFTSNNSSFVGATDVGSFTASPGGATNLAQVFDMTDTSARFVRLQINSNGGGADTRAMEVIFDTSDAAVTAVPEPSTFALMSLVMIRTFAHGWRRRQRQK